MASVEFVMNKALSYLGVKEEPAGSNKVIFNTDYYGREVSGSAYPWCCSFIWDIFRMCDASDIFNDGKKTAYCPTVESWGIVNKLTVDKSKGKYGDIVLFDFTGKGVSGHIGFIEKKNADGSYTTIEGNTSKTSNDNGGCVMRRIRSASCIRCIIRPKYDDTSSAKKTTTKKSIDEVAKGVINGKYGSGDERKKALEKDGYNYDEVQAVVNDMLKSTTKTTTTKTKVVIAQSGLNCRKSPSTSATKLGVFSYKTKVEVLETSGNFTKVKGKCTTGKTITGYCASKYLS